VGAGRAAGGRALALEFPALFELLLIVNGGRFEFGLTGLFVLPVLVFLLVFSGRLAFALRFAVLPFAFALLFVFLRLGLFSFSELASFVFAGFSSGDFSGTATAASPSFTPRLTSIATV
jgi:hypothetical protein